MASFSHACPATAAAALHLPRRPFAALSPPRGLRFRFRPPSAGVAVDSAAPAPAAGPGAGEPRKPLLEARGLKAVVAETRQEILRGVDLTIYEGEVHAVMGKNGSGKSTFAKVLVGHPHYEVTGGTVIYKGEDLLEKEPEERSHAGIFMGFQSPVEIRGLSNYNFLLMAVNVHRSKRGQKEFEPLEFFGFIREKLGTLKMDPMFLDRSVNEGFSGGEKKRNEILQLAALEADFAILDEIDSGLDVDALRDVTEALNGLLTPKNSVLMITHHRLILDYVKPAFVHVMDDGRIVKTGDVSLAEQIIKEGYKDIVVFQ